MSIKLTRSRLLRIVKEEMAKFGKEQDIESVKAEETDADDLADSLENKIDYLKALKIKETKLLESLKKVRIQQAHVKKSL